jgi:elongator complex protein 1
MNKLFIHANLLEFLHVMFQIYKHNRLDFIESDLKAALVENCESYEILLSGLDSDFGKYRTRLAVVRAQKERERLEILGEMGHCGYCLVT